VAVFKKIVYWVDRVARDGPHAMAVDEWLGSVAQEPVLRVYPWAGDWCSLGYFGDINAAQCRIDCPNWVRRITGGGVVDHRNDWTYSLVIPKSEPAAHWRGDASYHAIHQALATVLRAEGVDCRLSSGPGFAGEPLCFSNPVDHDIVGQLGKKIAGAGQRRSRAGLLHQGSLSIPADRQRSELRSHALAKALAVDVISTAFAPDPAAIERMVAERYGCEAWLHRR
jgi:lipoyl(octanoyl) transferase